MIVAKMSVFLLTVQLARDMAQLIESSRLTMIAERAGFEQYPNS